MNIYPTSIKQISPELLEIQWSDGHISKYELKHLRLECPCATCNGETILWKHYGPTKQIMIPMLDQITLTGIRVVGNYAIQLSWKDGHNTGIYTWEYLRKLCQCDECKSKNEDKNE